MVSAQLGRVKSRSSPLVDKIRENFLESSYDRCYLLISINACAFAANNTLCYSENATKGRVQREMICLQIYQSKVVRFFDVIVGLT